MTSFSLTSKRGFSLLEVMISLAILTISLVLLIQTQAQAVILTQEAELRMTATDLAQQKMTEALLTIEEEGFQTRDVYERGDFDDFGEGLNLDVGDELEMFEWEYSIKEVDITIVGEAASAANDLQEDAGDDGGGGLLGNLFGGGGDAGGGGGMPGLGGMLTDILGGLGFGTEGLAEILGPFVREVRVRVWWGDSIDEAEELGNEVILTTHIFDPSGAASGQLPGQGGAPGGLPQGLPPGLTGGR